MVSDVLSRGPRLERPDSWGRRVSPLLMWKREKPVPVRLMELGWDFLVWHDGAMLRVDKVPVGACNSVRHLGELRIEQSLIGIGIGITPSASVSKPNKEDGEKLAVMIKMCN